MSSSEPKICSACLAPEPEWVGSAKARCGHSMCLPCILTWSKTNASCPECRASFAPPAPVEPIRDVWADAWTVHQQHVLASAERRRAFLSRTHLDWMVHCTTCTDPVCMADHDRRTQWLNRGKLVPLPPRCSSLDGGMIGILMAQFRMSAAKWNSLFPYTSTLAIGLSLSRRQIGFMDALSKQNRDAHERKRDRALTAGSIKSRHGTTLAVARANLATLGPAPGVKVFKGFTPPKRGARTGDLYMRGTTKAICVGYNLWAFADGSRQRLKGNIWITTPPIDFETVD